MAFIVLLLMSTITCYEFNFYKQLNVQSIHLKYTKRSSANTDGNVTRYILQYKTDFDAINITAEKDSKAMYVYADSKCL